MDTKTILSFLSEVSANNNREWFNANREKYEEAKAEFERGVAELITALAQIDPSVSHLTVKECIYRFHRDTRFSPDKSPYKRHFGAYIAAKGKKALHGGYYLHLQPDNCFIATGSYWLPTNVLTACRNEIMTNADEWLEAVENDAFIDTFGLPGETMGDYTEAGAMAPKGFGIARLRKAPKGFPRDSSLVEYLKMKDYCCWCSVDESLPGSDRWAETLVSRFAIAKPMMDFVNRVIDDYE